MDAVLWAPVGAVLGAAAAAGAPWLIASCPDPAVDPTEDPDDFPDHVAFADLAARRGLMPAVIAVGAVVGATLGALLGGGWALAWLLVLLPFALALAVIDLVTWYLPTRLVAPAAVAVLGVQVAAAVALSEPAILGSALVGGAALGLYYGLIWLMSPRFMAFGDVRLAGVLGLALGPFGLGVVLVSVMAAALLALLALVPLRRRGAMIRRKLPYGPFLVAGAVVAVAVGQVVSTA